MADWNTHLFCANKVNESLGFEGAALEMFLYGNLLPDVNPGWLIKPKNHIDQPITHFEAGMAGQDYFWVPKRFFEKYKEKIIVKNPVYLGYLFHLWVDVTLMTNFVSRVKMSDMIDNGKEVREWKWKDVYAFIKKYTVNLPIDNIDLVVEEAKEIEEISVVREDLLQIPDFLINLAKENEYTEFGVFDQESASAFFESVCDDFVFWCKGKNL